MLQDRRNKIMQMIATDRMVKVADLMKLFQVSIETIRRDLEYLEKGGYVSRVYGGAVAKSMFGCEPEFSSREIKLFWEKQRIGSKAVELIEDGDTVAIDIGTTTREFAKSLRGVKKIIAITNSVHIAMVLADDPQIRVILLGGDVRQGEYSTSGFLSETSIGLFNVDKYILGVGGLTLEGGITDYHIEETSLRRHVIHRAQKVIALADHSKFGVTAMNRVCEINDVQVLVTDDQTDKTMVAKLRTQGVRVIVAE